MDCQVYSQVGLNSKNFYAMEFLQDGQIFLVHGSRNWPVGPIWKNEPISFLLFLSKKKVKPDIFCPTGKVLSFFEQLCPYIDWPCHVLDTFCAAVHVVHFSPWCIYSQSCRCRDRTPERATFGLSDAGLSTRDIEISIQGFSRCIIVTGWLYTLLPLMYAKCGECQI